MRKAFYLPIIFIFFMQQPFAQVRTDDFLKEILLSGTDQHSILHQVLNEPDRYRVQIIYTRINRDKRNKPSLQNYYFNYNPDLYYNPASTVKLPLALLSLEKINELKHESVSAFTTIQFDSAYEKQVSAYTDSSSENGFPSIAHYIKRAFLISENDPYNRMYQFAGQETIHKKLWKKGYPSIRIPRQFMGFSVEQNRYSNPYRFIDEQGTILYQEGLMYNSKAIPYGEPIKIGNAYMRGNELINEPFDFTQHNYISLADLQHMLQAVMFPNTVKSKHRFNLSFNDYQFLYKFLSQYPSETMYPKYDSNQYYDSYAKFFFRNEKHDMPDHVRVFNKVGWAYGFLTDVSFVVDFENELEYMLTATVYVNEDGILNDGKYEYNDIGYPFLYELGQKIYQYELNRVRPNVPDLSAFRLTYDQRDPKDTRPEIRDADN